MGHPPVKERTRRFAARRPLTAGLVMAAAMTALICLVSAAPPSPALSVPFAALTPVFWLTALSERRRRNRAGLPY
ncbi:MULTISPECIES: hypothetical protein [unclassified Streptomyces]|uniref:hypothetical protein n=1 Tax=unclassified Streptomyces TaxID=2593676 RepID=UPI0037F46E95